MIGQYQAIILKMVMVKNHKYDLPSSLINYFYCSTHEEIFMNPLMGTYLSLHYFFQHQAKEEEEDPSQHFFAIDSPLYLITLVSLITICVCLTLLGLCFKTTFMKKLYKKEKNDENGGREQQQIDDEDGCLLYTSPSPRDATLSRMPSSA